jgi:uncharacterized damage-inducible protein DinB
VNRKLHLLFNLLETDRAVLLNQIKKISPEQFHYAPEGKWSVSQILAHIIAGERLSVQYLNKKMLGINDVKNSGITEELKMLVLKLSQRLPFKFKAPRTIVDKTPVYQTLDDVISDWNRVRRELGTTLEKFQDHQINKKVYRHVRAGLLNVQHALLFFREHIIHHTPQIERLMIQRRKSM